MTEIDSKYSELGGSAGILGQPTSPESDALRLGRKREYQHGAIFWSPRTSAHAIIGEIYARWKLLGADSSFLGYPTTDQKVTPDSAGKYNHFEKGSIYWTAATGAVEIAGVVREWWAQLRWERGILGYPLSYNTTPQLTADGREVNSAQFQGGRIEADTANGEIRVEKIPSAASPNYEVPLSVYRASDDDGSNTCAIDADAVRQIVREANAIYGAAGIKLVFDGVIHDLHYSLLDRLGADASGPDWPALKQRLDAICANTAGMVAFARGTIQSGGFSSEDSNFLIMSAFGGPNEFGPYGGWLFSHELGHFLGLSHTQSWEFATKRDAADRVLSGLVAHDFDADAWSVRDTPPDPFIEEIKYSPEIDSVCLAGQTFQLSRYNVISYWARARRGETGYCARLTHDQIEKVREVLRDRQGRGLAVREFPPPNCHELLKDIRILELLQSDLELRAGNPVYKQKLEQTVRTLALLKARAKSGGCT